MHRLSACNMSSAKPRSMIVRRFLHLYSGERDVLAEALMDECEKAGIALETTSLDISRGNNLLEPALHEETLRMAKEGYYRAAHAGFPCGTFSKLRWKPKQGMPGPVRSREHIYGARQHQGPAGGGGPRHSDGGQRVGDPRGGGEQPAQPARRRPPQTHDDRKSS